MVWELDHKEGWAPKNWCFQTVVLEKTLESPLDSKKIKPVNPKGNQSWILIGRTDAEAPILWPSDGKSRFIGKDPDPGKDGGQEEKGATKDEMAELHHWFRDMSLSKLWERWRTGMPGVLLIEKTPCWEDKERVKRIRWGHHARFPVIWWLKKYEQPDTGCWSKGSAQS